VIPGAKDMGMHIQAYLYDGYWEDIGTVEAFYEANLALTDSPTPKFRWHTPPGSCVPFLQMSPHNAFSRNPTLYLLLDDGLIGNLGVVFPMLMFTSCIS
jgi:ADP-glucose pyrophosphorylase